MNIPSSSVSPVSSLEANPRRSKSSMSIYRAAPFRKAFAYTLGFSLLAAVLTFRSGIGINIPMVLGLVIAIGLWRKPAKLNQRALQLQLLTWVAIAFAFVIHLNDYTAISFYLSTVVLIGSLSFKEGVHPLSAFSSGLNLLIGMLPAGTRSLFLGASAIHVDQGSFSWQRLSQASLSVLLVAVIGSLYMSSNTILSAYWTKLAIWVKQFNIFSDVLLFTGVALLWSFFASIVLYQRKAWKARLKVDFFEAKSSNTIGELSGWSRVALTLLAVNIFALVLNTVDGYTTWFGEISSSGAELKRGVHAGTYTLITAILLASSYLLNIQRQMPADRGRVNVLASAWLGQNFLMALTVALRNYHYTHAYGLTYKRIGVWLFLICCATGLYFLNQRLRERSSFKLLLKRQSWAVYLVLSLATLPHWPGLITRYNLADARSHNDFQYLGSLLPYNYVQWKALSVDEDSDTAKSFVRYSNARMKYYIAPLEDWRAWDLAQQQLNDQFFMTNSPD